MPLLSGEQKGEIWGISSGKRGRAERNLYSTFDGALKSSVFPY
jgi:hypothetical protein